jgi:Tol biopolymer transport system component
MDGSGLTRLSEDPGTVATPVYSSDGTRLYFASTRIRSAGYEWEIYVMAAGGGEQRRLTREARPENNAPSVTSLPASAQ